MWKRFLFFLPVISLSGSPVNAAEINVISVGTVSPVLHDLIPDYERQSGNKLKVAFGNPAVTLERLTKGDPADMVVVAGALWDQAEKQGRVKAETKTELPATPYSIGMKAGTKPSGAATPDDFKRWSSRFSPWPWSIAALLSPSCSRARTGWESVSSSKQSRRSTRRAE